MTKTLNNQNRLNFIRASITRNLLALMFTVLLVGCSETTNTSRDLPETLRIGVLPDENKSILLKRYTPLLEYLASELDIKNELVISESYQDILDLFINNKIDLAYFGGVTFVHARHLADASPLVMRDIDTRFTSYFISRADNPSKTIKDYKGKIFSFGSKLSTSGHYMPRIFLNEQGISAESYFSTIKYSGAHDKTAFYVRDGLAELGVANSKIIDKMLEDKRLKPGELKVIWETPPYADYVWAIQSNFSEKSKTKLREAFLSLNPTNEKHHIILNAIDSSGFLPANDNDFDSLYKLVYPQS